MSCKTPGHEDKPEHGRSGLCQACYRRARRRALDPQVGQRKPGPKPAPRAPDAPRSHHKLPAEQRRRKFATDTHCANDHELSEDNVYYLPSQAAPQCKVCRANSQRKHQGKEPLQRDKVGPRNADKTHCPRDHEYTPENTYVVGGSARRCKTCARDDRLKYLYGLQPGGYEQMLAEQDGACAGCHRALDDENLHVDHDHACCVLKRSCGTCVRGLLCDDCNLVLGRLRDNVETLRRLADYIERHRRG